MLGQGLEDLKPSLAASFAIASSATLPLWFESTNTDSRDPM